MKKGRYILVIFLIFFILILATFASFIYFEFAKPPAVKSHSYLEVRLSGSLQEKACPDFLSALMGLKPALSMYDVWMNLQKAKVDPRINALVLRLGYIQCDWAKINELRDSIIDFRKSGKKAYAYMDEALDFDKEYFLATACDKIILHPLGMLVINGIGGNVPFLKKALDKAGIEAEVEHVEEYKTAYNMFTEEKFTPAHKRMMESIYSDLYSHYIKGLSEARGKTEEEIKSLIDHAYFQGNKAVEVGLIDNLLFNDEFENLLKEKGGKTYKITHQQYLKIKPSSVGLNKGKKIALIYGMGPIITGEGQYQIMGSSTVARWIKKARMDKSIAAVVFRVDSPGGSAVGSDIIWREIALAKKEKPVIVTMSDLAGSGGYWVAMNANKIVAQPQTLTGSIGVIFGKFNFIKLYDKLGITSEKLTYGKRADLFSTFRKLTPEERKLLKKEILWSYDQFVTKAAEGRKMTREEIDRIGKGRVWTGSQAKELGLVDEIGGLSKAVELAKELAGIPNKDAVKFVVWPKKISLFESFMGKGLIKMKLDLNPRLEKMLSTLKYLDKERLLAIMPFWIVPE